MSARQEWLTERNSIPGVGASESAALFGLHPNISAFSLFEKLVNPQPPTDEEIEEESDVKSFGLAIEPYLADWYARKTGRVVTIPPAPGVYRIKDKPFIFASPDRLLNSGVLQLKSAIYFDPAEPLPDYWQVQEQHEMLCTYTESASLAILGGFRRRYCVNDIPRNEAFCAILVETIERFMHAVTTGSWAKWGGDIEGSSATTEALKRLYKNESGTTVDLPAEACAWADELEKAKADIKDAEARASAAQNKLRAAIGFNTFANLPDGRGFSLKTQKRAAFEVKETEFRVLRPMKGK